MKSNYQLLKDLQNSNCVIFHNDYQKYHLQYSYLEKLNYIKSVTMNKNGVEFIILPDGEEFLIRNKKINWSKIAIWISIILTVLIPLLILFLKSSKQLDLYWLFR
jgi:hypothetical protein